MSTTIDERVVEMRFDNSHFEKHTRETMSTLDKLKQKLNLTGASKGLEDISSSAKKVDMSGLADSVNTVSSRFSALEVMGVTALVNITNSAVNAGKRIVSALTIAPVRSGFQEYETQLNAVQTIMANVGHKGKTLKDVNAALDELNEYADQTIYNFTEMTRNIGLFTNAGVGLEQSVSAIKGFSNAAAMAGTDATSTARAMYQLSQAMSAGSVKLMDWKSLEQANITGERFQETLKETAKVHGINVDAMIKKEGNFRETLASGWLTADLMSEALNHYTLSRESMTKAEQEAAKAQMKATGYTEEQIEKLFDLGTEASNAATKVKSFTQLWGVLQESAQSGWAKTWQLIVGDFEEAKAFFTPLANFLTGVIDKMSDARNKLIEGALGNPFTALLDKLNVSGVLKKINSLTKGLDYYQEMVNKVWRGDYKNQPVRSGLLEKEGHNYKVIQTLVNKGYQYKLTVEDVEEAERKYGVTTEKTTQAIEELSDAKLKEAGLTEDEIKLYRDLEKQAKETGKPITELIESMSKKDGRTLLIESLKNAGQGLVSVFTALGQAWREIFPPMSAIKLYFLIDALNQFSQHLIVSDDTADKLKRTLKGLFAIVDIILTVVGGPIKIALKLIGQLLGAFDLHLLDITAVIGDVIVGFRDWLDSILDFSGIFEVLATRMKTGLGIMKEWFKSLKDSKVFKKFSEYLIISKNAISEWFSSLKDITGSDILKFFKSLGESIKTLFSNINKHFNGVPGDILSGLVNGLKNGAVKVKDAIIELANTLINKFKEILGIHSPSVVFFAIGGFIISGLIGGLLAGGSNLSEAIGSIATKIGEFFNNVNWGKVFAAGISAGMVMVAKKLADIVQNITAPLEGVGELLEETAEGVGHVLWQVSRVVKGFAKVLNGIAFEQRTEGVKNLAMSLLILVGAFAIITFLDTDKMWDAFKVIAALAGILALLSWAISKISDSSVDISKEGIKLSGLKSSLLSMGLALLAITVAMKMIGGMESDQILTGLLGLLAVTGVLVLLMGAVTLLVKSDGANHIGEASKLIRKMSTTLLIMAITLKLVSGIKPEKLMTGLLGLVGIVGILALLLGAIGILINSGGAMFIDEANTTLRKISTTLLILAIVAKIVGGMKWPALGKAGVFALGFLAFVAILSAISMIPGKNLDVLGGMLIKISAAMLLMTMVVKRVGSFGLSELINGVIFAGVFLGFIAALLAITKAIPEGDLAKLGGTLIGISVAMLLLTAVIKILGGMELGALIKGTIAMALLGVVVAGLMYMLKVVGPDVPKLALNMLAISVAIGILAGAAILLSLIDPLALAKGVIAVGFLSLFMMGLINATEFAKDVKDSLIVMTVAIAVMAAAVAGLSFIEPKRLLSAAGAMGILMGMFALIESQSKHVTGSMKCMIVMTVAIAALAGALFLVGQLPMEQSLSAAGSLAILMLALTGVLFTLSKMNVSIKKAAEAVGGLALLCIPLLVIAYSLSMMKDTQNSLASVVSISLLLTIMTGVLFVLSKMSSIIPSAMKGVVGLTALCIPLSAMAGILNSMNNTTNAVGSVISLSLLLSVMMGVIIALKTICNAGAIDNLVIGGISLLALCGILGLIADTLIKLQGIENALQNATAMSLLLATMTGVIAVLSLLGPLAWSGIGAIVALTAVVAGIGALVTGLGYLFSENSDLEGFLNKGLDMLIKLGDGLGKAIGAFISGALTQISAGLPEIGTNLSLFMNNAAPFIAGVKLVDEQVLKGVGILTAAILLLTAADLISSIASIFTLGSSFADLGTELSKFMINATPFFINAKMIDPAIMTGVKTLADAVLILTGANILDGLTKWLTGGNSLAQFGSQLGDLGTNLNTFVSNLGTFTDAQVTTVNCAGQAIKALAESANALPNEGGIWGAIVGENSLATFGSQLGELGTNLNTFVGNLGTFTDAQVTTVDCAGRAIKALAEAAKEIPNDGGLWGAICGENSLATFSGHLPGLGENLASFVSNLGTFTDSQVTTVDCAGNAIKTLAEAASVIPNEGGLWAKIFGDNSLTTFAGHLPGLATKLKEFVSNLGEFSTGQVTAVSSACNAIRAFATLGSIDVKDTGSDLKSFGENMVKFAEKVKTFVGHIGEAGAENITSSISKVKELINMATTVAGVNVESLNTFGDSLKDFAKDGVNKFVKEFSDSEPKRKAKEAVEKMIDSAIEGGEDKKSDVENAFESIAKTAAKALNSSSVKEDAKTAGKNLVQGFVNGIDADTFKAEAQARAMALKALQAAKKALGVKSPSREFYKIGGFSVEGYINALRDGERDSYRAGFTMAEMARNGLSKAISKVTDVLNSDMDTQPTIRPVLDLSDVESGAGYLNTMFNNGPSIGVAANLRAISSGMNSKIQNGVNNDVVSAINKLRKDLGNISGGNTYNVNGITYDDGSNITDAVKTLIRAAKVERRV